MIWNEKCECMPVEERKELQLERLKATVENVFFNVPHYRKVMQYAGVEPDDIQTLEDIRKLPFTVKDDLRDNYPYGMLAVPLSEIVRIHSSSVPRVNPLLLGIPK